MAESKNLSPFRKFFFTNYKNFLINQLNKNSISIIIVCCFYLSFTAKIKKVRATIMSVSHDSKLSHYPDESSTMK